MLWSKDKLLDIKDERPKLKKVIYWDTKGLRSYDDPVLLSFDRVMELGEEYSRGHPTLFEENVSKGNGDDLAVFLYT